MPGTTKKSFKPKRTALPRPAVAASEVLPEKALVRKAALPVNGDEWVELVPQGIALSSEVSRPALLLRSKDGAETLPVWLNPLDAGVALTELSQGTGLSPHSITRRILKELNVRLVECRLNELVGHHQYATLIFEGGPQQIKPLRVRADEAMSFVLQANAKFLSTRAFVSACREVQAGLETIEAGIKSGEFKGIRVRPEISSKKYPYMM